MSKVIILKGFPASGKSTWARAWVLEDPENRVRFNRDDIRNMLGKYWVPSRERIINSIYDAFMWESMLMEKDIVIDNMNLNPQTVSKIEKDVKDFNEWVSKSPSEIHYDIEIKSFLDVPIETCIERDSKRENSLGKNTIMEIYNKYKHE